MNKSLRYPFRLLIFAIASLLLSGLFPGCDCSDSISDSDDSGECTISDDCPDDQDCIEGICGGGDNADAGYETDSDTEPDSDTGDQPDADAGDEPDVEPACPNQTSCAEEDVECGLISDGCGDTIFCGSCTDGHICGTGDDAGRCIETECTSTVTCEDQNIECGSISDGCGGTISCGACDDGKVCGTGTDRGKCIDPDSACEPVTCSDISAECGPMPDGCGGTINCGTCDTGQTCGTGANRGQCDDIDCTPLECSDYSPGDCGPHPNGCGGVLNCGDCSDGKICGVGSDLGACVEPSCTPLTCADYDDINCGPVSDGCGGMTANCGTCQAPEICGGGALPNVCGAEPQDGCDGLCEHQALCSGGAATTLTGTVFAPDGELPLANAVVYVPNVPIDDLPQIDSGAICQQCEDEDLGDPLVGTVSDFDGTFELRHVPAGVEFPLVIKIGQWRRVVTISPQSECETEPLGAENTRLPRFHHEDSEHDNIPRTAITTGAVDAMECVFLKLGVDESEFTRHNEDGRIHMYRANGGVVDSELDNACGSGWSATCQTHDCTDRDPGSCGWGSDGQMLQDNLSHNLYGSQSALDSYDMVVMGCEATDNSSHRSFGDRENIRRYVNAGGRLFASHYAYDWLHNTNELQDTANWGGAEDFDDDSLAFIDDSFPGGSTFWSWLQLVGANYGTGGAPQIEIIDPRTYVTSVNDSLATRWVYTDANASGHNNRNSIQQYTFDTPVYADADAQCGRVAYSAFHVADVFTRRGPAFPSYCGSGELSPQEKVLAYMLFDLASCVSEDGEPPPPQCTPRTCSDFDVECGVVADGCGGVTDNCGTCPDGTACGAHGVPNTCSSECTPLTCSEYGADCGTIDDGCGGNVDCGVCPSGTECGGGGELNVCGCEPMTCEDHNAECGSVTDGCGEILDCGDCPDGASCGTGGTPNICSSDCTELTCEDHGAECGTVSDGCGGTQDCGDCEDPETCGGEGVTNMCGCSPLTCEDHGAECGTVSDGCGNILECGDCPDAEECEENMCIIPQCRGLNVTCENHEQCCSGVCAIQGGASEGSCISG